MAEDSRPDEGSPSGDRPPSGDQPPHEGPQPYGQPPASGAEPRPHGPAAGGYPPSGQPPSPPYPPGQYGQQPPGQYGQPPPGQHGQPAPGQPYPPGQYGQQPPGQHSRGPGSPGQAPPYPPSGGQSGYWGGGQQQYPAYPGESGDTRPPSWSGLAIATLVTGVLLPLVGVLVAVPLGIAALVGIRRSGKRGKGLAIVGMVVALVWAGLAVGLGVWVASQDAERNQAGEIVEAGTVSFGELRVGDCADIEGLAEGATIDSSDMQGVPCSQEHNAETVAIVDIAGTDFPGDEELTAQAQSQCGPDAQAYLGGAIPDGFTGFYLTPTDEVWDGDNGHRVVCFVVTPEFGYSTGSVLDR